MQTNTLSDNFYNYPSDINNKSFLDNSNLLNQTVKNK